MYVTTIKYVRSLVAVCCHVCCYRSES